MTMREQKGEKKREAFNELRALTMSIWTLNLKHQSEKNEKRLSASRVGHSVLKKMKKKSQHLFN